MLRRFVERCEHRAFVEFALIQRQAPENIHVEKFPVAKPYERIDQQDCRCPHAMLIPIVTMRHIVAARRSAVWTLHTEPEMGFDHRGEEHDQRRTGDGPHPSTLERSGERYFDVAHQIIGGHVHRLGEYQPSLLGIRLAICLADDGDAPYTVIEIIGLSKVQAR